MVVGFQTQTAVNAQYPFFEALASAYSCAWLVATKVVYQFYVLQNAVEPPRLSLPYLLSLEPTEISKEDLVVV
jgi:hypothetical protein